MKSKANTEKDFFVISCEVPVIVEAKSEGVLNFYDKDGEEIGSIYSPFELLITKLQRSSNTDEEMTIQMSEGKLIKIRDREDKTLLFDSVLKVYASEARSNERKLKEIENIIHN